MMKRLICVCLLLLIVVTASAQPYAIGHRSVSWQDPERGNRTVTAEGYYPANSAGDNVPVASGSFPVVCFGHGFLLSASLYDYVWQSLVPEGFIVVLATTEGGLLPDHQQFGLDLAFLIRRLEIEGESPASPFYARIAGLSCVMGHSMGGGASFLAAASDPEIDAIANLAAAETNPSAIAAGQGLTIPALLFSGSVDCVTPPLQHQIPMYNALASECKFLLTITGASHCQFAEYNFACNLGEFACDDPTVSRAAQQQTVLDFVLPWLQFVLGEQPAAFCSFRDAVSTDPRITYLAYCSEIPAAPQLTIVPVTSGVELRWNAVPYACSYTLQRSITGAEEDFINYWIGSANEYTDLTNELLVFYRLRANNQ